MIRLRLFAALSFIPGGLFAQTAPPINPDLLSLRWPARWVGHAAGPYRDFGVFHFRKSFPLDQVPASFVIHVSADNRYRLYVNGTSVSLGPARSDLDHYRFETVDIARHLRPGRNVLAAVVWNFGIWSPMAQLSERTGLLVQGNGKAEEAVNTGPGTGWVSLRNPAYEAIPLGRGIVIQTFYVVGPGERVDASRYPWGWEQPGYDDSSWTPVASWGPAQPNELFQWNETRWMMTPRPIPPMEETPERLEKVVRFSGTSVAPGFVRGGAPFRVAANSKAVALFDRGYLTTAYPQLTVAGGRGAEIKISYAESLRDPKGNKGNRDETDGKEMSRANFDIYVCDGSRRTFSTLFWRAYRYLQLEIETREQPVEILDFQGIFSAYPAPRQAVFESPSEELAKILEIGWRTHRICTNETYFDTPQYEQLAYAGDGRVQSKITHTNLWDDRINRNHLEQFWHSLRPEGLIQDRYPSREPQYIPMYALDWIASIHDFYLYRGDPEFLKQFLPATRMVLDWFEQRLDGRGLMRPMSWNDPGYEGGRQTVTRTSQAALGMAYLVALEQMEELETAAGGAHQAAHYRALLARLRKAMFEALWSPEKGLVAEDPARTRFTLLTNALAVLAGAVPERLQRAAMENAVKLVPKGGAAFYGYQSYVPQLALEKVGLGDFFLDNLDIYRLQMRAGLRTWAEHADLESRSDSHSWNSVPNIAVFSGVAGIRPAAPGFRRVSIRPRLGGLPWIRVVAPLPLGEIRMEAKAVAGGLDAEVTLPEGVSGWFEWGGRTVALHGGRQAVRIPGNP